MKNGTKPLKRKPRKIFAHMFGGTASIPDFNLDAGIWNPNQNTDGKDTECTSYFVCDAFTDRTRKIYVPGFTFGATTFIENVQPTDSGADPLSALESAVACGVLQNIYAPVQPQSELEDANWANWKAFQKIQALNTVAADVHSALGFADPFTSILSASYTGKTSVALCTPWYSEWEKTGKDGIMPMPANVMDTAGLPWHLWAAKGQKTIQEPYIIGKSWQGQEFADNGLSYLSQKVANAVLEVPGTAALILIMTGGRWIPLVRIALQHLNTIPYILPQLPAAAI